MTLPQGDPVAEEVRRRFRAADPGSASFGLRATVTSIPDQVDRDAVVGVGRFALPAAGLAAAAVLAVLVSQGLGLAPGQFGAGATPIPNGAGFDPTLVGPGVAAPSSPLAHWLVTGIVAVVLFLYGIGVNGWRQVVLLGGMVVVLAYAAFCTFVPIDVGINAWAPGIGVVPADMPAGASENLYYVTAAANAPFAFGVHLEGADGLPVRIESIVTDVPLDRTDFVGMRWTAVWLDGEPHGGMIGPTEPFHPVGLTVDTPSLWIVGRASYCALGHVPDGTTGSSGSTSLGDLRLNVTILGWPREVSVQDPSRPIHLVEPTAESCPLPVEPASPATSPVGTPGG
jgi:hypothetical protein